MPWHPRIRFSLATLFIVVTAICVWLGTIADKKIKQRRGVERVEKLGGAVFFDFQRRAKKDEGFDHTAPPPGSEWARKWLGEHYFQTPVSVMLWGTRLTNDDLQAIAALRDLEQLQFHRVDLSAVSCGPLAALECLHGLAALDYLCLDAVPGEEAEQTLARFRQAFPSCMIEFTRREAQDD